MGNEQSGGEGEPGSAPVLGGGGGGGGRERSAAGREAAPGGSQPASAAARRGGDASTDNDPHGARGQRSSGRRPQRQSSGEERTPTGPQRDTGQSSAALRTAAAASPPGSAARTATGTSSSAGSAPRTATGTSSSAGSAPRTATGTSSSAGSAPRTATGTSSSAGSAPRTATGTSSSAGSAPRTATGTSSSAGSAPRTATGTSSSAGSAPRTATGASSSASSAPRTATGTSSSGSAPRATTEPSPASARRTPKGSPSDSPAGPSAHNSAPRTATSGGAAAAAAARASSGSEPRTASGSTSRTTTAGSAAPRTLLCPICNSTPLQQANCSRCTRCQATVCNRCGFNPNPHLMKVEWLCLSCQMQDITGLVQQQQPSAKPHGPTPTNQQQQRRQQQQPPPGEKAPTHPTSGGGGAGGAGGSEHKRLGDSRPAVRQEATGTSASDERAQQKQQPQQQRAAEESVTGKLFGYGASLLSQASNLIGAVNPAPGSPPAAKAADAGAARPAETRRAPGTSTQGPQQRAHGGGGAVAAVPSAVALTTPRAACPRCRAELSFGTERANNGRTCAACGASACAACGSESREPRKGWLCWLCRAASETAAGRLGGTTPAVAALPMPPPPAPGPAEDPPDRQAARDAATTATTMQQRQQQQQRGREEVRGARRRDAERPDAAAPAAAAPGDVGRSGRAVHTLQQQDQQQQEQDQRRHQQQYHHQQDQQQQEQDQRRHQQQYHHQQDQQQQDQQQRHQQDQHQQQYHHQQDQQQQDQQQRHQQDQQQQYHQQDQQQQDQQQRHQQDQQRHQQQYHHQQDQQQQDQQLLSMGSEGAGPPRTRRLSATDPLAPLAPHDDDLQRATSAESDPGERPCVPVGYPGPGDDGAGEGRAQTAGAAPSPPEGPAGRPRPRSLPIAAEVLNGARGRDTAAASTAIPAERAKALRTCGGSLDSLEEELERIQRHDMVEDSSEGTPSPLPRLLQGLASCRGPRGYGPPAAPIDGRERDEEEDLIRKVLQLTTGGGTAPAGDARGCSRVVKLGPCKDSESASSVSSPGESLRFDREPELESLGSSPDDRSPGNGSSSCLPLSSRTAGSATSPSVSSLEDDSDASPGCRGVSVGAVVGGGRAADDEVGVPRKNRSHSQNQQPPAIVDSSEEEEALEGRVALREQEQLHEAELQQQRRSAGRRSKREREDLRAQRRRQRSRASPSNLSPIEDASPTEELRQAAEMEELRRSSCSEYSPSIESEPEGFESYAEKIYRLQEEFKQLTSINRSASHEGSESYAARSRASSERVLKSAEEAYEEMMIKSRARPVDDGGVGPTAVVEVTTAGRAGASPCTTEGGDTGPGDAWHGTSGRPYREETGGDAVFDFSRSRELRACRKATSTATPTMSAATGSGADYLGARYGYGDLLGDVTPLLTPGISPTQLASPSPASRGQGRPGDIVNLSCGAGATIPAARPHVATAVTFPAIPAVRITQHFTDHEDGADTAESAEALPEPNSQHDYRPVASDVTVTTHTVPCSASPSLAQQQQLVTAPAVAEDVRLTSSLGYWREPQTPISSSVKQPPPLFRSSSYDFSFAVDDDAMEKASILHNLSSFSQGAGGGAGSAGGGGGRGGRHSSSVDAELYLSSELNPMALLYDAGESVDHVISRPPTASSAPCSHASGEEPGDPLRAFARPQACQWPDDGFGQRGEVEEEEEARCGGAKSRVVDLRMLKTQPLIMTDQGVDLTSFASESRRFGGDNVGVGAANKPGSVVKPGIVNLSALDLNTSQSQSQKVTIVNRGTNVPTNYKVAARPVPSPHDVTTTTTTSNSSNSISKPLNLAQNASATTMAPTNGPAFGLIITADSSVKAAAGHSAEASRAEQAERCLGAAGRPKYNNCPNGMVGGGHGPGPRVAATSPDGRPDEAASGLLGPGEGPADLVRGGDGRRATCCDVVYRFPFLRSPSLWGKPPSDSSPPPAVAAQGKADLLRRHESASAYHCFPLGPLRSSFSDTNLAGIGDYGSCPFGYDGVGTGKVMDLTAKNGFVARGSLLSGDVGLGAKFALGAYTECGLRPMRRYNSDHAISKMECDDGSGGCGASRGAHVDFRSTEETIREINKLCTELTSLQQEWSTYSDGKGAAPTSQLALAGYGVGAPALNALVAAVAAPSEAADYLVPAVPVTAQPSSIMGPLGATGYRNGATSRMEAAPNFEDFLPMVVQQQQWRRGSGSRSFSAVLAGAGTQAYSPDAVTATTKTASGHLGYGIPQLCTAAAVAVAGPGGYFGDGAPPGCSEENATQRLGPYVLDTIAPDTREGALVGQRWDEGEVTMEAEGRRWSLELEEHELLREKQAEQQQVQLQQQILELEKVKQRRLQEEMECERVEMRLRLDQEKRLVEQELSELHGMKRRLFRRQQEERREQLSLQQEQMVHHHVQIDKIKQLQTQLQQQLEEQKMIQATPSVASVTATAAFGHDVGPWWTTRAGQELGGPRWPAPGPHEAGAGGRVPRRPSRHSVARPAAELSLREARWRRPPRRRSLGSGCGGARSSSYWEEEDEEMDDEEEQNVGTGSVRRPWFDRGVRTDDDGDERRRSRRNGVDCGVQTDDEDGRGSAGWGSSSRRRRGRSARASGPGHEAVVGDGSLPARALTSSVGVQTSADCSVQTEPAPGAVSRRDRDDFYDISKPERTHLGRSSGCQTDGDGGKRPAPLEIGAAGFHPSDAGAGEASPRSPKLLFSPVSPLACGKPLDAPFGTSERLNKAHVSPQKHLPPTPAARQGKQGPPSRRHQEEEDDDGAGSHRGLQRSKAGVDGPGTGRKVKRTLPNPPMEERPPTGPAASSPSPVPSAASTRDSAPGAGGPDGRSAAPAGSGVAPVQRKQILREIDAELERVEHDSAKLRQRQEELDAEEREIDARMRNLERGLGRKAERNGGGGDVGGAADPGRYPTARALGLDAGLAGPGFSPARRQQEACLPGLYPAPAGPVPPCRIFPSSSYLAYPQLRQADGAEAPRGYAPSSSSLPYAIPTAPYPGLTAPVPQLKARQASLDLEPNLETNYEVVAEEELLGALLARRRSAARGGRDDDGPSSDAATVPLRDLAAAVGFAANSDAFYADLEQSVPRNYELIDDIGELTRTPAPSVVAAGDPLQCRQRRRPPEREPPFGRSPYRADAEFADDAYEQNLPRNLARFYRGDGNGGEPLGAVRAEPRHAEERPGHRPVSKAFSSAVISKRGKHKRQQNMEQRLAAAAAGAFGPGSDADMGYTGRYDGTLAWPEERPRRRHGDTATPLGGVLLYDDDGEISYNGYGPPLHDYAERYSCDPNAPPPPRFPPPRHRRADAAVTATPGADRAGSGRARERPRAASPERRAHAAPEWDEAPGSGRPPLEVRQRLTEREARRRQPGKGARLDPLNQRLVGFPSGQAHQPWEEEEAASSRRSRRCGGGPDLLLLLRAAAAAAVGPAASPGSPAATAMHNNHNNHNNHDNHEQQQQQRRQQHPRHHHGNHRRELSPYGEVPNGAAFKPLHATGSGIGARALSEREFDERDGDLGDSLSRFIADGAVEQAGKLGEAVTAFSRRFTSLW
ncbi:protein bassoon-like isoform X1 [Lampetra fluviatilis]